MAKQDHDDGSRASEGYPVLLGEWRVSEHGIFCGTMRIARFDFDTKPDKPFREQLYSQMEHALNANRVEQMFDRYVKDLVDG